MEATLIIFKVRYEKILKGQSLNIIILVSSSIAILYMLFLLVPYADSQGFFSENDTPSSSEIIAYVPRYLPAAICIAFSSTFISKSTFLQSLNYPLLIANIFIGICLGLIIIGGAILWLMIPASLIPIIAIPISFIWGLRKDIQFLKKYKNIQDHM
ncbi:hypothetical protein [Cohnella luojiensis]|uniref:Uncharacterized protein n=1 Tax=Cohnella luojiensis TaxID=652876 RepID=A0A4Y8LMK3_9BACL|nr:hypothetical protein [Cohnella luojiensis]TFE19176.1 hypothetical protein E2980_23705 [Cohnella luojiensis]